jgi:hypothetical protein
LQNNYTHLMVLTNKERLDYNLQIQMQNKLIGTLQNDFDTLRRILKIT